jgi:DNA-binding IclR family transcriptional regulator
VRQRAGLEKGRRHVPATADGSAPAYPIESVSNALRLLLLLDGQRELRVTECANALGVARSTAHRLLAVLVHHGFLRRNPATRTYSAGDVLISVGLSAIRDLDIRTIARPHIEVLVEEIGETVSLVLMDGRNITFVDAVETTRPLRVGGTVGIHRPAHQTSAGRAMLAELSGQEFDRLFPDATEVLVADDASWTVAEFKHLLAGVRSRGYAVARIEHDREPEIAGIGVQIPQRREQVPAGLAVAAPTSRMRSADLERCGKAALAAAWRIAEDCGLRLPGAPDGRSESGE